MIQVNKQYLLLEMTKISGLDAELYNENLLKIKKLIENSFVKNENNTTKANNSIL
jgi:hypothetical protein